MQLTTVYERNSFGMHNYGNHKAYLAVLCSATVNFLSDGRSFLQFHELSLDRNNKKNTRSQLNWQTHDLSLAVC